MQGGPHFPGQLMEMMKWIFLYFICLQNCSGSQAGAWRQIENIGKCVQYVNMISNFCILFNYSPAITITLLAILNVVSHIFIHCHTNFITGFNSWYKNVLFPWFILNLFPLPLGSEDFKWESSLDLNYEFLTISDGLGKF